MSNQARTPAGTPIGGQFAAPEPLEVALARALETQMGCAPGEVLYGADPWNGNQIPVGQMCGSSAHNHAHWDGSCQFATDMAATVTGALAARPEATGAAAEAKLARLAEGFDRFDTQGQFTGNYDADMASGYAWHEAAGYIHAVIDGTIDQPVQESTPDPWTTGSDEPPF